MNSPQPVLHDAARHPEAPPAGEAEAVVCRFRLRVQQAAGETRILELSGRDEADAVRRAQACGIHVLSIESGAGLPVVPRARIRFPLLLFSQELLVLLEAGLNPTEALRTLQSKAQQAGVHSVLTAILSALYEGRTFSDVLAAFPRHFPEIYVATVRSAERTGDLPHALRRYIDYQTQFEAVRKKLVSAAIYPAVLLLVGGLVTLFLLGYVVPRFAVVYDSSGRSMSGLSAILLSFGVWVHEYWQFVLPGFFLLMGTGVACAVHPGSHTWLLHQLLRLPGLARQADTFRLARFYRALALLLASGIALPKAMRMVSGLLGPLQRPRLMQCREAVEQGQSLSLALVTAQLADPVVESLVKVGERSGQISTLLDQAARFSDEAFARWIDWASRLLEPILMVAIGLVIGTVVVLMYLPIFELAGNLR